MYAVTPSPDAALVSAVDQARAAVLEIAPAVHVGDHEEAVAEDDHLVTHYFTCLDRGYRGWRWAASLVRSPGSDDVTVAEVVLLPGRDSLLAPSWVPWDQRVRPGDLGPGDLHPTVPGDPRLEPGFSGADALEEVDETTGAAPLRPEQWQLGLGRETVLSPFGRGVAADRWYDGEFGPDAPMAKAAPAHCATCGFLLPIGGQLGQVFGACTNPLGADGRVVALGYGCGAHSSVRPIEGTGVPVTDIAVDDGLVEVVDLSTLPVPRPVLDDDAIELVEPIVAEPVVDEAAVAAAGAAVDDALIADGSLAASEVAEDVVAVEDVEAAEAVEAADDVVEELEVPADADESDEDDDEVEVDEDDEDDEDEDEDDEDEDDEDDDEDDDDDEVVVSELDDVVDIEPDEVL
jgi:hypothetical protein